MALLEIRDLSVEYYRRREVIPAVRGVSLSLEAGQTLAVVGESGSGKSTLASAILGLISAEDGRVSSGVILFEGNDLLSFSFGRWRTVRGRDIAIVFQDPFSSLNPVFTIGDQLEEAVRAHFPGLPAADVQRRVEQALREVKFADTGRITASYPHQLSGGQRQRIIIAMAIVNRPKLLVADEPTTALDVTIQKEILDLLDTLKKELSLTVLLITHNLPLAYQRSDRIAVMRDGQIVETGRRDDVFFHARHPYTQHLLRSVPRMPGEGGKQ